MKKLLCLLLVIFPSFIKVMLMRLMGAKIGKGVFIGFSYVSADKIVIGNNVSIGNFNVIKGLRNLEIGDDSTIGKLNVITSNDFFKTKYKGAGVFLIGKSSSITMRHYIDVQEKITIGDASLLAGIKTLIFTHQKGVKDLNEAKPITIGNKVYLGAACLIMPGVVICDHCIVAAGSILSGEYDDEFSLISGGKAKFNKRLSENHAYFTSNNPAGPN